MIDPRWRLLPAMMALICAVAWKFGGPPQWVDPWTFASIGWMFANWFAIDVYLTLAGVQELAAAYASEEGRADAFYAELQAEYRRQGRPFDDFDAFTDGDTEDDLENRPPAKNELN